MKKIYLIRHAKSSWSELGVGDFERDLNKRGKNDAPKMGKRLKKGGIFPDLVISSPAKRAKKTAKMICKEIGYNKEDISYKKELYEGGFEAYLSVLQHIDDKHKSVFLVAHNNTITFLAEKLANIMIANMPTCSIVAIKFDCKSFKDIKPKEGKMIFFDFPKSHEDINYM
ncbi:MAG: histidine phosphatase [Proteobacteria bacterium]|nr:MAG: histidine phosphatase [Pseudomonadota bacterium]